MNRAKVEIGIGKSLYAIPEFYPFLNRSVFTLRWATITLLLLLTLIEPRPERAGIMNWTLVAMLALYNLLVDLVAPTVSSLRMASNRAILDLPVAALIYYLGGETGTPLFVPLFLAVICASVSLTLLNSLIYTAVAACAV